MLPPKPSKLVQIKSFCQKPLRFIVENSFWLSLVLIFLSVILAASSFLFYIEMSTRSAQRQPLSSSEIKFEKALYEKVLSERAAREKAFEAVRQKEYSNPWQP